MCLATASLAKHKDGPNATIACNLHDFCGRMLVDSLVAGGVSKHLVKLEEMMTWPLFEARVPVKPLMKGDLRSASKWQLCKTSWPGTTEITSSETQALSRRPAVQSQSHLSSASATESAHAEWLDITIEDRPHPCVHLTKRFSGADVARLNGFGLSARGSRRERAAVKALEQPLLIASNGSLEDLPVHHAQRVLVEHLPATFLLLLLSFRTRNVPNT